MDANGCRHNWHEDGTLSLITYAVNGHDEEQDLGEVRLNPEQWLDEVATVLWMLLGKPNEAGDGFAVAPVGTDPAMIGDLIATRVRRLQEGRHLD